MDTCDVLIVGGGSAGSAVALALKGSRRAVVVDKRVAPWRKPCDGVLTPMSQRALVGLGIDPVRDLKARDVHTLRILDFDNHRESETRLSGHLIVDRMALDQELQRRAAAQPQTAFLDGSKVVGWKQDWNGFTVDLIQGKQPSLLQPRFLVDATGAFGLSRRTVGPPLPCVLAVQHWYKANGSDVRFDWIFDRTATPFYLWAINNGSELALGAIFPLGQARQASLSIENRLKPALGIRGNPSRIEMARMAMPTGPADNWFGSGPLLATGEAAGLINAGTGEGISFGLRSGIACGLAIEAARDDTDLAARTYRELVADLARECALKASQARRLFDAETRRNLSSEELLVPVKRSRVHDYGAPLLSRTR